MKKIKILALLASMLASTVMAETVVATWDYPEVQLMSEYYYGGSGQFGDFNNDDNLDLIISNRENTILYEWDNGLYGNKIFDELNNLLYGGIQWLDYNNDGFLDIIIVACTNINNAKGTSSVSLYKNIEGTSFMKDEANSEVLSAAKVYIPIDASIQPGRIACGDFNNDGWVDVVFSGYDHWRLTKLFWNNQGAFETDTAPIEQVNNNGTYVADFDNDGYMDFIAGGYSDSVGKHVVNVFFSNGDKTFTMLTLGNGCEQGNLMVMDADNDGNQDIFVSGDSYSDNGIFMLKNNGDRTFTFKSNSEIGLSEIDWGWASTRAYMVAGDLNNDGYNDIVTQCAWDGTNKDTYILFNNGDGTFTRNDSHRNREVYSGGISIFDYNHDGKLDIHVYGTADDGTNNPNGESNNYYNNIMVNTTDVAAYTAPTTPDNATFEQVEDDVVLTWNSAYDEITDTAGIRYNVYAKNLISGEVAMVAPANIETGYLKFTNHGSFLNDTVYTFKGMNADEYEFGVQAINNGNIASAFAVCEVKMPSDIDEVEAQSAVKVNTINGNIRIINKGVATNFVVYAASGVQIATGNVAANTTANIKASKGIYIVKVGAKVEKVVL